MGWYSNQDNVDFAFDDSPKKRKGWCLKKSEKKEIFQGNFVMSVR